MHSPTPRGKATCHGIALQEQPERRPVPCGPRVQVHAGAPARGCGLLTTPRSTFSATRCLSAPANVPRFQSLTSASTSRPCRGLEDYEIRLQPCIANRKIVPDDVIVRCRCRFSASNSLRSPVLHCACTVVLPLWEKCQLRPSRAYIVVTFGQVFVPSAAESCASSPVTDCQRWRRLRAG